MAPAYQAAATAYSHDFLSALSASGLMRGQHGGFLSACMVHCDAGDGAWTSTLATPAVAGSGPSRSVSAAFSLWLNGSAAGDLAWWVDTSMYPNQTATCK
jgi:hypothetical protein